MPSGGGTPSGVTGDRPLTQLLFYAVSVRFDDLLLFPEGLSPTELDREIILNGTPKCTIENYVNDVLDVW